MTTQTLAASGLSLGAAGIWGGGDYAGGIAAKRANVFRVVAGAHACGLIFMLLLALATREAIPSASSLEWGAVAGAVGAFGLAALYRGLAIGRMGIVAPVAAVVTGILPVLFGMRTEGLPDRIQLAGFALALVSIWLIARPSGEVGSNRGLGLAVLAGIMFGLFLIAGKQAGHQAVFWPLVSARAVSVSLVLLIVLFTPRDGRSMRGVWLPIVISGTCDSGANALYVAATQHGRLDVAAVLSSLYPASTVILARVLLKEHLSLTQNIGIVAALVSVALISLR